MKTKIFKALVLLISVIALLSSCAKGNKFTVKEGNFVDKETGVEYISTSWEYEPISRSDEVYGEYSKLNGLTFYKLNDIDPKKYICDNMDTLYYAKNVLLPTFTELDVEYVNVYNQYDELVTHITDAEFIEKLRDTYLNGYNSYSSMYFESEPTVKTNQRIKFADPKEGFYYVLAYVEYLEKFFYVDENGNEQEGNKVLFNRYTHEYIVVDDFINDYYATLQE